MDTSSFSLGGPWIIEVMIALLILCFANFGLKKVLKSLRKRMMREPHDWRDKIDKIFYRPFHLILWVIGIAYILDVLGRFFHFPSTSNELRPLRDALIVSCLGWLAFRWQKEVQHSLISKPQGKYLVDSGVVRIIGRLLTMLILIVTTLLILQVLGLNTTPLVAFGGIGAAAVGFAGKDVIANFFGGLMLYVTRPFTIGDQIEIPERNIEGTVEEIGWYLTAIRDKDKCPVYLPNAMFSTILVINSSRMTHRRIEERIKVPFEAVDKIEALTQQIHHVISSHRTIDNDESLLVSFETVTEYGLQIYIDAYSLETRQRDFLVVKQEVLIAVQQVLKAYAIKTPFPTTTIDLQRS